jgi:hypothetical protein
VGLSAAIAQPMQLAGHTLRVTASIGVAPADEAIRSPSCSAVPTSRSTGEDRGSQYASWRLATSTPPRPPAHPGWTRRRNPRSSNRGHTAPSVGRRPHTDAIRIAASARCQQQLSPGRRSGSIAGAWRPASWTALPPRCGHLPARGLRNSRRHLSAECVLARPTAVSYRPVSGQPGPQRKAAAAALRDHGRTHLPAAAHQAGCRAPISLVGQVDSAERAHGPHRRLPSILTVDDDAGVSRAVARDLGRQCSDEYRIVRAGSGEQTNALRDHKLQEIRSPCCCGLSPAEHEWPGVS